MNGLRKILFKGKEAILSLIYPAFCLSCGKFIPEGFLCPQCLNELKLISPPFCPLCGLPYDISYPSEHLCTECLSGKRHFKMARSAFAYEGVGRELIHSFKFGKKKPLLPFLSQLMWKALSSYPELLSVDLVVSVPLHPKRERERGFNQSALLAKEMAKRTGLPFTPNLLRKVKLTPPQSSLTRKERLKVVKGAFTVAKRGNISLGGKKILLVDDILTTGATADECTRTLLSAGAKEVFVFTLARTP